MQAHLARHVPRWYVLSGCYADMDLKVQFVDTHNQPRR